MMAVAPQQATVFTFGSDPYRRLPVVISNPHLPRCIIIVGGQTDGLFSLNYVTPLIDEIATSEWAVCQVMFGSSFAGPGGVSHLTDAGDLEDLVSLLVERHGMKELTLFAFSSGVQVLAEYFTNGRNSEWVSRVILQGIVCDPTTDIFTVEGAERRKQISAELVASGKKEEFLSPDVYDLPISALRGRDSDIISVQEAVWVPAMRGDWATLHKNLSLVRVPLLVMLALGTGYKVPAAERESVIDEIKKHSATPETEVAFFEDTSDERRRMLKTAEAKHTAAVVFFLMDQDRKRMQREEQLRLENMEEERRNRSILAKSKLPQLN